MDKVNKKIDEMSDSTGKLADNLDKVDVKVNGLSVSAKDVAGTYKREFVGVVELISVQMAKMGAIITELNAQIQQVIDRNREAGQKLAQNIEEGSEAGISSMRVAAIKAGAIMDEFITKTGATLQGKSEKLFEQHSEKYQQQVALNTEFLKKTKEGTFAKLEEINQKYSGSDIGLFNFKEHKKNVEKNIAELTKYKQALQDSYVKTGIIYDSMAGQYAKDSDEFKKIQNKKKEELKDFETQMKKVDETLKDTNASYLSSWDNRWKAIGTKLKNIGENKIPDFIKEEITPGVDALFGAIPKIYEEQIKAYDKEIAYKEKKKKDAQKKLDEELKELTAEVDKEKKALAKIEAEKGESEAKQKEYEAQMQRLKEEYGLQDKSKEPGEAAVVEADALPEGETPEVSSEHTEEEIAQAQERFDQLKELGEAEKLAAAEKADKIRQANIAIFESEQKVLDEKKRIEKEKAELEKNFADEKEKIEKEKQKKQEQLDKANRIKAKVQHVVSIAQATADIAKGIAKALSYGPFLGPVLAAGLAVAGAIQIGVMTKQLQYMEEGGLLRGKRHRDGGMRIEGTNIEVEGGEYVVNRKSTEKNLPLLRYINGERRELRANDLSGFFSVSTPRFQRPAYMSVFEDGGQVPVMPETSSPDVERLLAGMENIKIEPKVSVTDINTVQQQMVKIDEWTGTGAQ